MSCRRLVFHAKRSVALIVLALSSSACLTAGTAQPTPATARSQVPQPCARSALRGSFTYLPGSIGAGNLVYVLSIRNDSATRCRFGSDPAAQLLSRENKDLPTHFLYASHRSIVIGARHTLFATARFSPDVPGQGEQIQGACELGAFDLRLSFGRAVVLMSVMPSTPVCQHGLIQLSSFGEKQPVS